MATTNKTLVRKLTEIGVTKGWITQWKTSVVTRIVWGGNARYLGTRRMMII